jgi:hypothetical protein
MKKLLTIITLFFPALLFAQQKGSDFITKFLYFKISPSLMGGASSTEHAAPVKSLTPFISGTIGARIRYAAAGFSIGHFNLGTGFYQMYGSRSVTPLGVDLTITDFKGKRKKIFPVITGQWYHTNYNQDYVIGRYGSQSYHIIGKDMYTISGGITIPVFKTGKILITLGFGRLRSKTRLDLSYGPYPGGGTIFTKDHQDMVVLGTGLAF